MNAMLPSVVNVAGEPDRELRSPPENALEALWLACEVLILLWPLVYSLGMLVATLCGSFFGMVHADSYSFVLVTGGLGTIFTYAAMEYRLRNLAAFALVHGFIGSTFHKLLRDGGILSVNCYVGPWSVRAPSADPGALFVRLRSAGCVGFAISAVCFHERA